VSIRLNKLLARRGLGARRKCDDLIRSGLVSVNGQVVTEPGTQVEPERDRVLVRGRALPAATETRYYVLHKPVGVITTLDDPEGRRTVRDLLPPGPRLFPVGRLDADTSGLLVLTNDGELAHRLMHPRYGVVKSYRVRVARAPDERQLQRLREGVEFEPGIRSAPARAMVVDDTPERALVSLTIHEGRYRQVRRMFEAVGLEVLGLHRSAYGPLRLGPLPRGMWRELSEEEVARLRAASARARPRRGQYLGVPGRSRSGPPARERPPGPWERTPPPDRGRRPEGVMRPERFARPERPGRGERSGPTQRSARPERPARRERGGPPRRFTRAGRPGRGERGAAPQRFARPERRERPARGERGAAPQRFVRPERPARRERGGPPQRFARPGRPVRGERGGPPQRFARPERPPRRDRAPRGDRGAAPQRFARPERPARRERAARPGPGAGADRFRRAGRSSRPDRTGRGPQSPRPGARRAGPRRFERAPRPGQMTPRSAPSRVKSRRGRPPRPPGRGPRR